MRCVTGVLQRQGLTGPGHDSVLAAVRAAGGVYGTTPACVPAVAARTTGPVLDQLDELLHESRTLVRVRCMRGSLYAVPRDWLPAVVGATATVVRRDKLRTLKAAGLDEREYERHAAAIEQALAGEPLTPAALRERLGGGLDPTPLSYVMGVMRRELRLVYARNRGWTADAYTHARWEDWVGEPVTPLPPAEARAALARIYAGAFGPATVRDLAWWTGWTQRDARAAMSDAGLEPAEGAPEPVDDARLLGIWDAYVMGYQDRSRWIEPGDLPLVYDRMGNAASVVLARGRAVAVWELDRDTGRVRVAPFDGRRLADAWELVEAATARLGTALGLALTPQRSRRHARPLPELGREAFRRPVSRTQQTG